MSILSDSVKLDIEIPVGTQLESFGFKFINLHSCVRVWPDSKIRVQILLSAGGRLLYNCPMMVNILTPTRMDEIMVFTISELNKYLYRHYNVCL